MNSAFTVHMHRADTEPLLLHHHIQVILHTWAIRQICKLKGQIWCLISRTCNNSNINNPCTLHPWRCLHPSSRKPRKTSDWISPTCNHTSTCQSWNSRTTTFLPPSWTAEEVISAGQIILESQLYNHLNGVLAMGKGKSEQVIISFTSDIPVVGHGVPRGGRKWE